MQPKPSYREWLKQDLGSLIDALDLEDIQKRFLRSRWLDELLWMESRSLVCNRWHYALRLTTTVGGVIVPALVGWRIHPVVTGAVSLAVAISAGVEELLRFGERWRHYRRTAELMKIEGWRFFQMSSPYQDYESRAKAYPVFAARIEDIHQSEVDVYITQVVREEKEKKEKAGKE